MPKDINERAIERYIDVNGVRLCFFESGAAYRDSGTFLLVHATGFHGRCWDKTVEHLGQRHVIAIDLRGHGRSADTGPFTWDTFGRDVTELLCELDLHQVVAVGHSLGGHVVTQAAALEPARFTRLVLVDPVILAPSEYVAGEGSRLAWLSEANEHPVARRRNQFKDADAMFENLVGRGSFASWREDVLHDYCNYGLIPNPSGEGFVLACPPDVEAAIYSGSSGVNIYKLIERVEIPVVVLRARPRADDRKTLDFSSSPTWDQLAGCFKQSRDIFLPHLTHFIPMQDPELTARYILGGAE